MAKNAKITDFMPTHCTPRKRHKVGIVQKLLQYTIGIFQVPFPFNANKLCLDKIKICLDIGPALLASELLTLCIAIITWPDRASQYTT